MTHPDHIPISRHHPPVVDTQPGHPGLSMQVAFWRFRAGPRLG